jgi:subtilisin
MRPGQYVGVSPGADLFSARVFDASLSASQIDIANALDVLVQQHQVDLVNMSLAAPTRSVVLQSAVRAAFRSGVVCVCASGNSGNDLQFPAALPEVIAVGAIGAVGWGSENSVVMREHATVELARRSPHYYSPAFSCVGRDDMVVAPGVGIVSTVTGEGGQEYGEMTGTSMAAPVVCGTIAAYLSSVKAIEEGLGGLGRVQHVHSFLASACRSAGLPPRYQGRGIPTAPA